MRLWGALILSVCLAASAAAKVKVPINQLVKGKEKGDLLGYVVFEDTGYGLLITPNLLQLTPGSHGFHLHANPACGQDGKAAGGHFDPGATHEHAGPYADGHVGDLPALWVNADGHANLPVLAPRLREKDLMEHALVVHTGGDNYADVPKKLGGGGARVACGVVHQKTH